MDGKQNKEEGPKTVAQKLDFEKEAHKNLSGFTKLHLYKEGQFYRLYNESAWLLKTILCTEDYQRQRGDDKPLEAFRSVSSKHDYAVVGFPITSLSKFLVNHKTAETGDRGDTIAHIDFPFGDDVTIEQVQASFKDWMMSLPVKETRGSQGKVTGKSIVSELAQSSIFGIISQVMAYPVESSTPAQNIEFISNLRRQACSLLMGK